MTSLFQADIGPSQTGAGPLSRAGEMIPEVEGTKPCPPPPRKRVPKCLKGPKTTYTTIATAEKQSKRSKKGPFSLYIGSPWSHPGNGIYGARRGRSLPVSPVSPAMPLRPGAMPLGHVGPSQTDSGPSQTDAGPLHTNAGPDPLRPVQVLSNRRGAISNRLGAFSDRCGVILDRSRLSQTIAGSSDQRKSFQTTDQLGPPLTQEAVLDQHEIS